MSGRSNAGRKVGKAELKNRSPSIADWPLTFRLPFGLLQEHSFGLRLRTLLEIGLDLIDQSPCFRRPNFERRVHFRLDFIAFVFFATFLAVFFLPTDFRPAVGFHAFAAFFVFCADNFFAAFLADFLTVFLAAFLPDSFGAFFEVDFFRRGITTNGGIIGSASKPSPAIGI
jgi:hypothetical protein